MGGDGGESSSTTTTTTTNTSGSNAAQGDNNGTMISGVNNSQITVTDHGAVNGSLNFAGDVVDKVLESNTAANNNVVDVANNAMSTVKDSASQMAINAKESMNFAKEMATTTITGGSSEGQKQIAMVVVGCVVVIGVVFGIKAWKS
ncbi:MULTISPECIES: hypothetical protein [Aliivibrio]|uniref:Chemotaxis protein n=1 Tax=Aliivibrio finisterrensis TaxID=511998 RepID=A0A4V1Z942_9GAMM|nr:MULTISPECIES: hypothetical protein [Aliivibrio]MDD9178427.1 hypothetical protein [Aliivibrio sp. A6]RYU53322.1 hypothetical protein ERW57_04125 [Aliivibrio finisterrensis]RYU65829.1 hypothetical protein ERW53_04645 [Aliivibrio finisterrensis]RYU86620.1 hypothetical protein ERW52_05985 [Aliivibrio finisterrensis]